MLGQEGTERRWRRRKSTMMSWIHDQSGLGNGTVQAQITCSEELFGNPFTLPENPIGRGWEFCEWRHPEYRWSTKFHNKWRMILRSPGARGRYHNLQVGRRSDLWCHRKKAKELNTRVIVFECLQGFVILYFGRRVRLVSMAIGESSPIHELDDLLTV